MGIIRVKKDKTLTSYKNDIFFKLANVSLLFIYFWFVILILFIIHIFVSHICASWAIYI